MCWNLMWAAAVAKKISVLLFVTMLAACGSEGSSEPQITPTSVLTLQPMLDLDQIPILEDNPAPPVPLAATDVRFPIELASGSVLEIGKLLYERFCASCHGINGEGKQPDPYARGAAPSHDATGHRWHHADQQNFLTVWQGSSGVGVMPAYYERLTPDEIIAILAYIKTWWQPDQLEHQMELTRSIAEQ